MSNAPRRGERLVGRVALVFGAGSVGPGWGNGKASAVAYARESARVVCIDRMPEAAAETARLIREEGGVAEAYGCDVLDEDGVARTIAEAAAALGIPAILHNNVGYAAMGDVAETALETWRHGLDVNVTGAFLACKHALPLMLAAGRGVVTNISSVAGHRWTGYPYPSYAAGKAALNQLTVSIALRHARQGIRANAILPGLMDTPHIDQHIAGADEDRDAMRRARHAASPTGRMGTAWDVAHAAVFLASDEAGYINGVCLPVDGGISARAAV
ncbi:MAG: SDR family oxidoreductase [Methylobacteriaceae bacterium]|nr:SDR family oxidoreductase [Methylobacteriaceae bacterium]